jgi:hypothetical protein
MGACSESEKEDKVRAHRAERRKVRELIKNGCIDLPHKYDFWQNDVWKWSKDGKTWFGFDEFDYRLWYK